MRPLVVLVHSPSVGPRTWRDVAGELHRAGIVAVVPDLRRVTETGPPYWPRVVHTVVEAIGELPSEATGPVVLVPHSNAGLFVPMVVAVSPRPIAGVVFVDAALPLAGQARCPVAPPQMLDRLRSMADDDGHLPRWTDWWDAGELTELLPDPSVREEVVADQSRLPLAYFEHDVPIPATWPSLPCAYLQFCQAYEVEAQAACRAGWSVGVAHGEHLHQVVAPEHVTRAILELIAGITSS
jgi:hypothetical protein